MNHRIPLPRISFAPPVYLCPRNNRPFTLDGQIAKPFWEEIPYTDDFKDISGPGYSTPRFRTRAKMCWDDNNLYVAALLEGDELWAHITKRDDVIFHDNDFEVFIDPDSDTQIYYEFEMNALNTVWDLLLTKAYHDNGSPLNSLDIKGLRTAVHINGTLNKPAADNKSWSVEIVFPFETFMEASRRSKRPEIGDYWRMNFSRVQWLTDTVNDTYVKRTCEDGITVLPEDNWVWSPTGVVNIHYPELWGFVFFTEKGESYEIPAVEYRKWELRRIYYLEHMYHDFHGRFTNDRNELLSMDGIPEDYLTGINATIEITSHTFDITQTSDTDFTVYLLSDGKTGVLPA